MRGVNFTAYQKRRALKYWLEEKLPTQERDKKWSIVVTNLGTI